MIALVVWAVWLVGFIVFSTATARVIAATPRCHHGGVTPVMREWTKAGCENGGDHDRPLKAARIAATMERVRKGIVADDDLPLLRCWRADDTVTGDALLLGFLLGAVWPFAWPFMLVIYLAKLRPLRAPSSATYGALVESIDRVALQAKAELDASIDRLERETRMGRYAE